MRGAHFQAVDPKARTAVLVLPAPTPSLPRLDHNRSRLVVIRESGLWQLIPGDDAYAAATNLVYKEAQQTLAESSRQPPQELGHEPYLRLRLDARTDSGLLLGVRF